MTKKITYKDAGVDIELADRVLGSLSDELKSTFRPEVIGKMGGFAAMFRPNLKSMKDPLLVSATDGVGTKLKIAFMADVHDTVGIDLVAMNVNDLLVCGAEPLFFLDYFATGTIRENIMRRVVSGITAGCRIAGCALIGGETAEMPDFYAVGEYDLAGFCVGMVDGEKMIDGSKIVAGDGIIGLESSGLHSNGFSLVRKVFLEVKKYNLDSLFPEFGRTLAEELLTPTRIYVKPVLNLLKLIEVKGMAHITGGGFIGNIPRILPSNCGVKINTNAWRPSPIFNLLQRDSGLGEADMFHTFNMGIGFILVVAKNKIDEALSLLSEMGVAAKMIGEVEERTGDIAVDLVH